MAAALLTQSQLPTDACFRPCHFHFHALRNFPSKYTIIPNPLLCLLLSRLGVESTPSTCMSSTKCEQLHSDACCCFRTRYLLKTLGGFLFFFFLLFLLCCIVGLSSVLLHSSVSYAWLRMLCRYDTTNRRSSCRSLLCIDHPSTQACWACRIHR
jgi:hypothetical protein